MDIVHMFHWKDSTDATIKNWKNPEKIDHFDLPTGPAWKHLSVFKAFKEVAKAMTRKKRVVLWLTKSVFESARNRKTSGTLGEEPQILWLLCLFCNLLMHVVDKVGLRSSSMYKEGFGNVVKTKEVDCESCNAT